MDVQLWNFRSGLILLLSALSFFCTSCGVHNSVGFSQEQMASTVTPSKEPVATPTPVPSGIFETKVNLKTLTTIPLDIVWVIDNSGSMDTEAAHVRSNFQSFISSVSSATDLRIALISELGDQGTAVRLQTSGPNYLQIDRYVHSQNPLEITASALCKHDSTHGFCAITTPYGNDVRFQLFDFLRPAAKKVFVFVTDDNSYISATDFMTIFNESYPSQKPTVYGFIGLGSQSPCQAKTGAVYRDFAHQTGGKSYNVCDADWSQTFKSLANNVIQLAVPSVTVPAEVTKGTITKVELNGKLVSKDLYSISSAGLKFDASIVVDGVVTLKVYFNR